MSQTKTQKNDEQIYVKEDTNGTDSSYTHIKMSHELKELLSTIEDEDY